MKKNINNKVYFIGIGGIGMSALAKWYQSQNWTVFGSDTTPSPIIDDLERLGIRVMIGQKASNLTKGVLLVIRTAAVTDKNPEFQEAERRGIKTLFYSEALGELTRVYKTFAVAGSHGKSTTTALLALALIKGGLDPTVIIGTKLKEFGGSNFRIGQSSNLLVEADEWHASFLDYSPTAAILTNIDKEHLDFYKNFDNVKKSFLKFINKINKGVVVLNEDDTTIFQMKDIIEKTVLGAGSRTVWYSVNQRRTASEIRRVLGIFGEHNVSNALGAYTLAKEFGVPHHDILEAFRKYSGSWRRMESRGFLKKEIAGAAKKNLVLDDYAHHPTEIKATLKALKTKYPKKQIVCVFQPHQAQRLKLLFDDFIDAFADAYLTVLLPVYQVAGRDDKNLKKNSEALSKAITARKSSGKVFYLNNPEKLPVFLKDFLATEKSLKTPPFIVMMGAGDIATYTDNLI